MPRIFNSHLITEAESIVREDAGQRLVFHFADTDTPHRVVVQRTSDGWFVMLRVRIEFDLRGQTVSRGFHDELVEPNTDKGKALIDWWFRAMKKATAERDAFDMEAERVEAGIVGRRFFLNRQ